MKLRQKKKIQNKIRLKHLSGVNDAPRLSPREINYARKHFGFVSFHKLFLDSVALFLQPISRRMDYSSIAREALLVEPAQIDIMLMTKMLHNKTAHDIIIVSDIDSKGHNT